MVGGATALGCLMRLIGCLRHTSACCGCPVPVFSSNESMEGCGGFGHPDFKTRYRQNQCYVTRTNTMRLRVLSLPPILTAARRCTSWTCVYRSEYSLSSYQLGPASPPRLVNKSRWHAIGVHKSVKNYVRPLVSNSEACSVQLKKTSSWQRARE